MAGIHIALSRQVSHIKYLEIMNQLQEYMRHQQLPLNIQTRLVSFYEYRFQNKYFRENTITASLSSNYELFFFYLHGAIMEYVLICMLNLIQID